MSTRVPADSAANVRHAEVRHIETHRTGAQRNEGEQTGKEQDNRAKKERTEADRNSDTDLWTTVSGFESLPPSQLTKVHTTTYANKQQAQTPHVVMPASEFQQPPQIQSVASRR